MKFYKAEYIWIDGVKPVGNLRSKTKLVPMGEEPPVWGFDGSSTQQAPGEASDCVLQPVCVVPDPLRGGAHRLVLCEVLLTDMTPHPTNTRAACRETLARFADLEPLFGLEQEYVLLRDGLPLGFPAHGFPAPQGPYYCSVGAGNAFGREIVEEHLDACLAAGLRYAGLNAEVMAGQWEFQIGPASTVEAADHLWLARWLLQRVAERHGVQVTLAAKPVKGDWNGSGCHSNFSTNAMRESYEACVAACEALSKRHDAHIRAYGEGIEQRLTGHHETASHTRFSYGVSNRGASVRIPWQVERDRKGYIEDRRPNANIDPYTVTRMITETVCAAAQPAFANA